MPGGARPSLPDTFAEMEAMRALLAFARGTGRCRLVRRLEARAALLDCQLWVEEVGALHGFPRGRAAGASGSREIKQADEVTSGRPPRLSHAPAPRAMPCSVRLYPERRLVVVRLSGVVSGEDLLAAIAATAGGPWESDFDGVADLRDVTAYPFTSADSDGALTAVAAATPLGRGGRTAYLVLGYDADAAARRLIRETAPLAGRALRVHYTAEDAAEWLGVPVELLEAPADEAPPDAPTPEPDLPPSPGPLDLSLPRPDLALLARNPLTEPEGGPALPNPDEG